MPYTKVPGHTVLINARAVNATQMQLVDDLIKWNKKAENPAIFTRKILRQAHNELRGKKACPYFITKNIACKVKGTSTYDVSRLHLSADAAKEPTPAKSGHGATTAKSGHAAPAAKKESKPKKEAAKKKTAQPATKKKAPGKKKEAPATETTELEGIPLTAPASEK